VVLYFGADDHAEGQRTVVTEQRQPLGAHRVVRGREQECGDYYRLDKALPREDDGANGEE
jgi:putative hydrolase